MENESNKLVVDSNWVKIEINCKQYLTEKIVPVLLLDPWAISLFTVKYFNKFYPTNINILKLQYANKILKFSKSFPK